MQIHTASHYPARSESHTALQRTHLQLLTKQYSEASKGTFHYLFLACCWKRKPLSIQLKVFPERDSSELAHGVTCLCVRITLPVSLAALTQITMHNKCLRVHVVRVHECFTARPQPPGLGSEISSLKLTKQVKVKPRFIKLVERAPAILVLNTMVTMGRVCLGNIPQLFARVSYD